MRVSSRGLLLAAIYVAGGVLWIYAVVDRRGDVGNGWELALLLAATLAVGAAVGEWWVVPVPLLLIPLALPAGGVPGDGELGRAYEFPLLMAPGLMIAVAIGVGARRLAGLRTRHQV